MYVIYVQVYMRGVGIAMGIYLKAISNVTQYIRKVACILSHHKNFDDYIKSKMVDKILYRVF